MLVLGPVSAALIALCFSHVILFAHHPLTQSSADLTEDGDSELVCAGDHKEVDGSVEHDGSCNYGIVEVGARQANNSVK